MTLKVIEGIDNVPFNRPRMIFY